MVADSAAPEARDDRVFARNAAGADHRGRDADQRRPGESSDMGAWCRAPGRGSGSTRGPGSGPGTARRAGTAGPAKPSPDLSTESLPVSSPTELERLTAERDRLAAKSKTIDESRSYANSTVRSRTCSRAPAKTRSWVSSWPPATRWKPRAGPSTKPSNCAGSTSRSRTCASGRAPRRQEAALLRAAARGRAPQGLPRLQVQRRDQRLSQRVPRGRLRPGCRHPA